MKRITLIITAAMLLVAASVFSQTGRAYWRPVSGVANQSSRVAADKHSLSKLQLFELDANAIRTQLASAPKSRIGISSSGTVIGFPNPDGTFGSYRVTENSAMDPVLQAKYPDIRSYVGKGIEDPTAIIYFSVSPLGVETMLLRADQPMVLIEPYTTDLSTYAVYKKGDRTSFTKLECTTIQRSINPAMLNRIAARPNADDATFRTFRLALSATGEYTTYFGGTIAGALAAMNATVTRVNGIFETDFGVHFNLVANNNLLIYTNAATDPYSRTITNQQVQTTISTVIGDANYDMGEVFGTQNQGGNAGCIGCVCVNPADAPAPDEAKGSGYTAIPNPTGDIFDIDFVSHEFGHTLGANHTFSTYSYEGTIAQVEIGSGTTIMSYAGYTGATDVLAHPYPYMHAVSIQQVTDNIKSKTCSVNTPTGNAIPTANAGADYTIPNSTPFTLTGAATDANDASLLYNWEQMDAVTGGTRDFPAPSYTNGPVFRNFNISSSNTRTFPELAVVLVGATSSLWETVPNVARTLNFRFTVRDNHAGGPANNSDDMVVTTAASGPFVVTQPTTAVSWPGNSIQTITWDVAGSTDAPVSCANVKISLSTDGGLTFPTVLLASTPNDGSENITVPNVNTTAARIKVEAVNNIFFDISNANFTITAVAAFDIVATSGANGTVTPAGTTSVASGASQTYTITPNAGFSIADVLVDGLSVGAVTNYTFTGVTAAHTISATFAAVVYTITASAGPNGTISPSGAVAVTGGTNQAFTITPNAGFSVASVLVDGLPVGAVTTYTFSNVTAAHTISATFAAVVYTITASAGVSGVISPSGAVIVASGANQTFTITPDAGFVANVVVDGLSVGAVATYTFSNVTAAHNISASFTAAEYIFTASAGPNGTISPSGNVGVLGRTNQTFTITPNAGFAIADVLVDGLSVGPVSTYTFNSVTAAHSISASFSAIVVNYIITASAGANGTISPIGAVSVAGGTNKTFTITPNPGFVASNVFVDGISQNGITTYTFTNVTANHTINANFLATAVNQPPVANAGGPVSITLPATSTSLNGSASYDPDGNIVQYYWYQTQGPVTASIANFTAFPNITGLTTAGTYIFGLQVKDNVGVNSYSSVVVTVKPAGTVSVPACVVNASPANASVLGTQTTATLTWPAAATATSYDVYLAAGTGIPATLVTNTASLNFSAAGLTAGTTYSWYIAPRNASGPATACGSTNKTTFTTAAATAGNLPPVANAGGPVSITLPATSTTLNGSASYDPDGNIVEYYWYQAQGPVTASIANFTAFPNITGLTTAGTYIFGLQVKDNKGVNGYSSVVVTVKPAGTVSVPACVVNASPANGTVLGTQTTATLTWPAAATATSYDVYLAAGTGIPATLVTNTASLNYSAAGLTAGTTYSWYIAPRNASGPATACGSTNKTTFTTAAATAGNQPPVSNAGANTSIVLPASSVSLNGSMSFDPDGNIVQYYWFQAQGPVQSVIGNNFLSITTASGLTTAGTYVFGLQVKDNNNVLAYSYKTVVVKPVGSVHPGVGETELSKAGESTSLPSITAVINPNPVVTGQQAKLQIYSNRAGTVTVNIVSSNGAVIDSKKLNLRAGINTAAVNTAKLAQGFHIISISGAAKPLNLKFVVQ